MNDNIYLDLDALRLAARKRWMAARKQKLGLQERISQSVPWWLIIVAAVLFLLSAPHTAEMFNLLVPRFGFIAPFGIEFGLLYVAFSRARTGNNQVAHNLLMFETLLFITSIIVNGAGALTSVTGATGLDTMSSGAIAQSFSALPIKAQIGIFLVPLAALIIPIGTHVAGSGLADLVLRKHTEDDDLEHQWQQVEIMEIYSAAYAQLVKRGTPPGEAQKLAWSVSRRLSVADNMQHKTLSAAHEPDVIQIISEPATTPAAALPRSVRKQAAPARRTDTRAIVRTYLEQHPDAINMSVRTLADAAGVSKTIAHEVLSVYKIEQS